MLERGKDVHERRKDIALISREHKVNGESNYSFGEGGAGAFSDGKLYTRSKKRGNVEKYCAYSVSLVHPPTFLLMPIPTSEPIVYLALSRTCVTKL